MPDIKGFDRPDTKDFDLKDILTRLPHRYPFLLVDRIVECGRSDDDQPLIRAYKNVSCNEPFFQGHFPDLPVMPGVLILEALAQAGGILVKMCIDDPDDDIIFMFTGIDKVRFRRPVRPGDRLDLFCLQTNRKLNVWKMCGKAMVDNQIVCEAELTAAMVHRDSF